MDKLSFSVIKLTMSLFRSRLDISPTSATSQKPWRESARSAYVELFILESIEYLYPPLTVLMDFFFLVSQITFF
jgi:hypothetical protein